ncbi:MAG: helix-turn-helix domain-containing protein [Muribaculaceae bacterium]|nr:helix-turn-helix domain-containing protein [Muribaculaceae bacterium]
MLLIICMTAVFVICVLKLNAEPKAFFEANKSIDRATLLEKGTSFIHENIPDSAIAYFILASQGYNSPNLTEKDRSICAKALSNIGYVQIFYFNDYPAAYSAITSSNELATTYGYTHIQCINDINLGSIYSLNKDFDEAAQLYRRAFNTALQNQYNNQLIAAFVDLVDIYFYEKDDLQGMKTELHAFPVDSLPLSNSVTPYVRNVYRALKSVEASPKEAIHWLNLAKDSLVNVNKGERYRYNADYMISRILQHEGKPIPAANQLKQMVRDSAMQYNPDVESMAYLRISKYYNEAQIFDSAQHYKICYLEMNDSISTARKMMEVKDLKASHERQAFASEITRMTDAQIFQRRILTGICIALAIVLALLAAIVIKNRQLHSRNVELYMRNRELLELHDTGTSTETATTEGAFRENGKLMSGSDFMVELRKKILNIMESDEVFLPTFNSSRLATLCDTNTRYISGALAEMKEGGFPALLAETRVREAMRRLDGSDTQYANLTIEAIGESVGFKSRSTFSTAFKRVTGLTPNDYRRISIEKRNKGQNS